MSLHCNHAPPLVHFPHASIVTRMCGKHMAVQSEDTPSGRPCEQCAAKVLSGGAEHSPPYIWNNSNYLLKMTDDLAFLKDADPLLRWLGETFELQDNPFLLAPDQAEDGVKVRRVGSAGACIRGLMAGL